MDKQNVYLIMENYKATKKNKVPIHAVTWMNHENILSGRMYIHGM